MKSFYSFLVSLFIVSISFGQAANTKDSLSLVDIYNSSGGNSWFNHSGWLAGPVSGWYGVMLGIDGKVTAIDLIDNNLTDTLPASIGNLTSLQSLDISFNLLSGNLPSSMGNLTFLQKLYADDNQFTGSLPQSFGNLTSLLEMDVSFNLLTDSLPASVSQLQALEIMQLSFNQISGSIPSSIGNLKNLQLLDLEFNEFSGSIPQSIGSLSSLTDLDLDFNLFTGTIPASFSQLNNLQYLFLNDNNLSSPIPLSIGLLPSLSTVSFYDNAFVFDGGLENIAIKFSQNGNYSPQSTVPLHSYGSTGPFSVTAISYSGDGDISAQHDTIYWYKNNILDHIDLNGDTSSSYSSLAVGDTVYAKIRSSVSTDLTLYSNKYAVSSALPVVLISFSARLQNHDAVLSWKTSSETNVGYFNVQRSLDGSLFTTIAKVAASGSIDGGYSYSYNDKNIAGQIATPKVYYRIETVDKSGIISYTSITFVDLIKASPLYIYPNPVSDKLNILAKEFSGTCRISIADVNGKIVYHTIKDIQSGSPITISLQGLASGVYFLNVTLNKQNFQEKFIKK